MRKKMLALLGAAAFGLGGVLPPALAAEGTAEMLPMVTSAKTVAYVQSAGQIDLFEVEAAKLALQRSQRPDVRAFAGQMAQAHQESAAKLQGELLGIEPTITLPAQLDAERAAKLAKLEQASGADFDRLYIQSQVAGHQEALKLHQAYVAGGDDSQLKTYARGAAAMTEAHLAAAKGLAPASS